MNRPIGKPDTPFPSATCVSPSIIHRVRYCHSARSVLKSKNVVGQDFTSRRIAYQLLNTEQNQVDEKLLSIPNPSRLIYQTKSHSGQYGFHAIHEWLSALLSFTFFTSRSDTGRRSCVVNDTALARCRE